MGPQYTHYDLKIVVLSPLHIGAGVRLDTKSLWLRKGKVWVVDEEALFRRLSASPALMSAFEKFALNRSASLGHFLKETHIPQQEVALYSLEHLGKQPNKYYFEHIKQPGRPPRPYIPGSSLKGALRSALLRAHLIADSAVREQAAESVRRGMKGKGKPKPKRADDILERNFFGKDQHHDFMRLFRFSDTAPVPPSALWATEVRILSVYGKGQATHVDWKKMKWGNGKPTTLHPEVLRPGVVLHSRLTIMRHLLSNRARSELHFPGKWGNVKNLLVACNRVTRDQIIQELEFAEATGWDEGQRFYNRLASRLIKAAQSDNVCLLRLGWGAGYDDKTIADLLDDKTFEDLLDEYQLTVGRPRRKLENRPLPRPLSPKSRKVALNGKRQWIPLGWIEIEIS